jgi:hypothetical protein
MKLACGTLEYVHTPNDGFHSLRYTQGCTAGMWAKLYTKPGEVINDLVQFRDNPEVAELISWLSTQCKLPRRYV